MYFSEIFDKIGKGKTETDVFKIITHFAFNYIIISVIGIQKQTYV